MFHNFFILFSSVSPSTACCLFSLDTTCPNNHISFIHLMLLFICNAPTLHCKSQDFNTSHVTLYRFNRNYSKGLAYRFNTSHVTLYLADIKNALDRSVFQYISCYSLSRHTREDLNEDLGFNTSHVTLYHRSAREAAKKNFCFNTSHVTLYPGSGYPENYQQEVSIHLMLLFIAQTAKIMPHRVRFNTSHVTLYQKLHQEKNYFTFVSIHLMLLFIQPGAHNCSDSTAFQYISCYSLSQERTWMCRGSVVSIHLMLLFIGSEPTKTGDSGSFNTSHVTLYRVDVSSALATDGFQYISCYSLSD